MTTVTQWFDERPVNRGVYQRLNKTTGLVYFAVFDGCWFSGAPTPEIAQMWARKSLVSVRQVDPMFPWRGLAVKP